MLTIKPSSTRDTGALRAEGAWCPSGAVRHLQRRSSRMRRATLRVGDFNAARFREVKITRPPNRSFFSGRSVQSSVAVAAHLPSSFRSSRRRPGLSVANRIIRQKAHFRENRRRSGLYIRPHTAFRYLAGGCHSSWLVSGEPRRKGAPEIAFSSTSEGTLRRLPPPVSQSPRAPNRPASPRTAGARNCEFIRQGYCSVQGCSFPKLKVFERIIGTVFAPFSRNAFTVSNVTKADFKARVPIDLTPSGRLDRHRGGGHPPTAESPRGISPRGAHRSGRKPLDLSGSCHPLKAAASHRNHRVPPVAR